MTQPTDDRRDPQVKGAGTDAEKEAAARDESPGSDNASSQGGQVSEVARMNPGDADTPISDSQSVSGQPDGESGKTNDGPAGPNARMDEPSDGFGSPP